MSQPSPIFIVSAQRTPFGRFLGSLAALSPVELAVRAGNAALSDIERSSVDLCIFGNVLGAGQGMNIARQIGLALDLPITTPAYTVNQMCASGMSSVLNGIAALRAGEAEVVLCGGTESMSQAPRLVQDSRLGKKLGNVTLVDSLLHDGLTDPSSQKHMGLTAETLAEQFHISRQEQDEFALRSHQNWAKAEQSGLFASERLSLDELSSDEQARPDSSLEKLAKLPAAFSRTGTVTAANASGINDGAAVILLATAEACARHGWQPLAEVTGWSTVGCDPATMGLGPVHAIRKLCARFNLSLETFDTIEINEAFAAQALACAKDLQLGNLDRLNKNGGAIAIGHPIGASGARLVTHLAHEIKAGRSAQAIGSLCVGGGMGIALSLKTAHRH